jgi:3-methylcrotonyl-CoA carboxylase beta subunit
VDAVLDPVETRQWLALGLGLAAASAKQETRFGVFRM